MPQQVTHLWRLVQAWLDKLDFPPSQSRLAERVGVARSAVSDWKYGRSTPTPAHMRALAELMEPQLGPATYGKLIEAMNRDGGYLPSLGDSTEGGGAHDRGAAANTPGDEGPVINLGGRRGRSKLSSPADPYGATKHVADDPDGDGSAPENEGPF